VKKAGAVNTIAESISRIRKAEDFTRQQDYIKRSAEILKIDEAGLHALVNKFIRERISKEEFRKQIDADKEAPAINEGEQDTESSIELLNKDEQQERALTRCLLEFGMLPWTEEQTVADYILHEKEAWDLIEIPELIEIVTLYKIMLNEGEQPEIKRFMYHENPMISRVAVSLQDIRHELSHNWKKEPYSIVVPTREELYREELQSVLLYLKLRKVKKLIEENQRDIQYNENDEDMVTLLKTHQYLKNTERELTKLLGTVIFR
jgi:DNA primase